MGIWQAHTMACKLPSTHFGCHPNLQHAHGWAEEDIPHINTFSGDATLERQKYLLNGGITRSCAQGPLPRGGVLGEYYMIAKGTVEDMSRFMGPTTSADHILHKLSVTFGTVALFDMLMQNVYKVSQGNNEKFPPFLLGRRGPSTKSSSSVPGG